MAKGWDIFKTLPISTFPTFLPRLNKYAVLSIRQRSSAQWRSLRTKSPVSTHLENTQTTKIGVMPPPSYEKYSVPTYSEINKKKSSTSDDSMSEFVTQSESRMHVLHQSAQSSRSRIKTTRRSSLPYHSACGRTILHQLNGISINARRVGVFRVNQALREYPTGTPLMCWLCAKHA